MSDRWTEREEALLSGGPQDGAKIKAVGGDLPRLVYVGPKNLGDGYAAWGRERSERFPVLYAYCAWGNYVFMP